MPPLQWGHKARTSSVMGFSRSNLGKRCYAPETKTEFLQEGVVWRMGRGHHGTILTIALLSKYLYS
jgi:hypothetical protein